MAGIDRLTRTLVMTELLENRRHERQAYYTYREGSIPGGAFSDIYIFAKGTDLHIRGVAIAASGTSLRGIVEKAVDFNPATHTGAGNKETLFLFYDYLDVTNIAQSECYQAINGTPTFVERVSIPDFSGLLQAGGQIVSEFNFKRDTLYRVRVQNISGGAANIYVQYDIYPVPRDTNLNQYFEKFGDV
jgi:hypothetical protein